MEEGHNILCDRNEDGMEESCAAAFIVLILVVAAATRKPCRRPNLIRKLVETMMMGRHVEE